MAASSSVGSDVFALAALLVISLAVLLLIRHYLPLRSTPAYLLIPVFLALALPSSIILLVPIDLASSSGTDSTDGARGIWLPARVMLVAWRIAYWLTFTLTWIVLPLLGEYSDSGYREPRDRFIYSLRANGRYQLMVLGTGGLGAVYFFLQSGFGTQSIKALVMALAYAWGLILAIYLMGHGLVALPRRLFRNASVSGRLKRLQTQAPKTHEKMEEAGEELYQLEEQLARLRLRKSGMDKSMQDWVEELAETSAPPAARPQFLPVSSSGAALPPVVTERYLAELARKLKRTRHKKARFILEWSQLVQEALDLQAILDAASSHRLDFGRQRHGYLSRLPLATPWTRYHLYTHLIPASRIALGSLLALASVSIIWSEFTHKMDQRLSIVGLTVIHHPDSSRGQIGFFGQVIAAMWLLYMCAAALFSVSEVKVWGNRALVKRQTYAESACWYSLQVAKLTVPLSYNFITMMPRPIYQDTAFYNFLGKLINLTPISEGFNAYFPIFILLPVCATLFNLYGKVKNVIGFGVLEDESGDTTFGTGGWREGQVLIERERQTDSNHLGLAGTSSDGVRRSASPSPRPSRDAGRAPLLPLSEPAANPWAASQDRAAARQDRAPQDRARPRPPPENEDNSDRYFFQDFGERLRNTFDTNERPAWISELGDAFKKPKWMSNDQRDGNGGSSLGKWFGGRPSDGRVRL